MICPRGRAHQKPEPARAQDDHATLSLGLVTSPHGLAKLRNAWRGGARCSGDCSSFAQVGRNSAVCGDGPCDLVQRFARAYRVGYPGRPRGCLWHAAQRQPGTECRVAQERTIRGRGRPLVCSLRLAAHRGACQRNPTRNRRDGHKTVARKGVPVRPTSLHSPAPAPLRSTLGGLLKACPAELWRKLAAACVR